MKNFNHVFLSKVLLIATSLSIGCLESSSIFAKPHDVGLAIEQSPSKAVIKGTVVDENNEPIIGASVIVKNNSSIGTITDINGEFELSNASVPCILVVSYVGYQDQEVSYDGNRSLRITLEEDTKRLDEVVVVAYGTVVKRKITNAVSTVDVKQIEDLGGYSDISAALQGRTPGAIITNSSGMPGSTPNISIRGGGTPLFVIDGIVQDQSTFNLLNSQDIESISIMKDAASAAVYGALAGNGIVVVKTKSGKAGKVRINYTLDHQFNQPTNIKKNANSYDLAVARNYLDKVYGYAQTYTQEDLDAYRTGSDPVNYPNVLWRDAVMRDFAQADRHSLTVEGGNEDTQFHLSLGYFNQGTIAKPIAGQEINTYQKANIGANVTHYFRNIGLKVGLDMKNSFVWKNSAASEYDIMWAAKSFPTEKIYNPDGTYFANTTYISLDPRNGYNKSSLPVMNSRLNLDWDVYGVKGLKLVFVGNYKTWSYNEKSWNNAYVQSYRADGSIQPASSKPSLNMSTSNEWKYEFNIGLQYKNTFFKKHNLGLSFFYNQTESYYESLNAGRKEYLTSSVDQIFAGPESGMTNGGSSSETGRLGYVGVLDYDFLGRYIIGASLRVDGSDNYSDGNRYGYFPSFSAGYILSDEPFIRPLAEKLKIDMFKLRGSWGKTGIDGERFAYYSNWSMGSASWDINGERAPLINTPGLISPDLTWYSTASTNFGIDLSMFNNRLSATFDYFTQETKNYLRSPNNIYKTPLGTSLPKVMSDDVFRRAGSEFTIRWRDSYNDLKYEVGMNVSFYDEVWKSINEDPTTSANPLVSSLGKTLSDGTRTWIADGLYQSSEDLLNNPHALWATNVKTGDIKYVDVNGDGRIDTDGTYSGDRVYNGMNSKPIMQYGIDFNLAYKGFSLSGLIQGSGENYKLIGQNGQPVGLGRLRFESELDFWTPENTGARYPIPDTGYGLSHNQQGSTFWELDCKYVRLKNLQLSYDFKYKLLKNVPWVSNLTLSLVGQNLLTLSKANDYFLDPEQGDVENYGYPIMRTYSFVLNLGF